MDSRKKTTLNHYNQEIIGAVVVNRTVMIGNLSKNILAYSAVHSDYQGKGFGQVLVQPATLYSDGDLAPHIKEDNPDCCFYKHLGSEEINLELRCQQANI